MREVTPPHRGWRLHLYVTGECNLRCHHCAVVNGHAPHDRLSADDIRNLIDQAVADGVEAIAFGGGEPLLRPDLLDILVHAAPRVKTILATNATLLNDFSARTLADLDVIVQVSIDGPTAEVHDRVRGPGAFDRAWQGIERLQRAGVGERLALNVTLMRPNVASVAEIVALAEARGAPGVRFTPVQRMGAAAGRWAELCPTPDEYAAAYRYLYGYRSSNGVAVSPGLLGLELDPPEEGMWCGLGHTLLVDAQGDIYPCSLLTEPRFRLGNVAETSLAEALASEQLAQLVALCGRRRDEIAECQACAWRHFCQGGCPGSVWLSAGIWYATDGLCELRREMFHQLVFEQANVRYESGQTKRPR
jgi:radical SAM protein with 4Fe4S-binding SPASM domain